MQKKNVLVAIANGIEELEAVTIIDVLRRAQIGVRVSSIEAREIIGANGIKITADSEFIDEVLEDYDGIILPGGSLGAERFYAHSALTDAIKRFDSQKQLVAAICASPATVLAPIGILNSKKATCYPSFKEKLAHYVNEPVVIDGTTVTSQGPGTALRFAFTLVDILAGAQKTQEVKTAMLA